MNRSIVKKISIVGEPLTLVALVTFILIEGVLAFFPELWGSSEAREAHVVALMSERADWILPLRNGLVPSKPPLFHWVASLINLSTNLGPLVSARLVSTLSAAAILVLIGRLARIFSGLAFPLDYVTQLRAGWLAPALLITSYGFIAVAVDARVDMCFCLFVVAAVSALIGNPNQAELREGPDPTILQRRFSNFFILAGFACLAKGPLGFVLPAIIGFSWHCVLSGGSKAARLWITPRVAWVLFLLIALPWYLAAALKGGDGFIGRQLLFENLRRLVGGEFVNSQPWHFYAPILLATSAPWSVIFVAITIRWLQRFRDTENGVARNGEREVSAFLLAWFWSGVLLFSLASGKRAAYLLPLLPGQALLVALYLVGILRGLRPKTEQRCLFFGRILCGVTLLLLMLFVAGLDLILLPQVPPQFHIPYWPPGIELPVRGIQTLLGVLLVVAVILLPRFWRRLDYVVAAMLVFVAILISAGTSLGFSIKAVLKGFPTMAGQVVSAVPVDAPLYVVRSATDEYYDPILYYLGREVQLKDPETSGINCPGYTLARSSWMRPVLEAAPSDVREIAKLKEWYGKARNIQAQELSLVQCGS